MRLLALLAFFVSIAPRITAAAHAHFHVHYPWLTRVRNATVRPGLEAFQPFCGDIIHNPQRFSALLPTFVSFSGHSGDLVSVRYTRSRVPRSRSLSDFPHIIASDMPIPSSGQLCFDIQMPEPAGERGKSEYGVMLFEAVDPTNGEIQYHCSDLKLVDMDARAPAHPALCARNNDTLIPMPDEWL